MPRKPIPSEVYPSRRAFRGPHLCARQIDGEGGPFARGAPDGDPAAVVLGHVPYYGEPQSRPAGGLGARLVHAVETLEDAGDLPIRYADARVGDANAYLRIL